MFDEFSSVQGLVYVAVTDLQTFSNHRIITVSDRAESTAVVVGSYTGFGRVWSLAYDCISHNLYAVSECDACEIFRWSSQIRSIIVPFVFRCRAHKIRRFV